MPLIMNLQTYYRTAEVCQMVGISRNTLFRWLKRGLLGECERRDRNGWRLFTEDEVNSLRAKASQIIINRCLR
jgi:predicted site-specific integrase-resolvase